MERDKDAAVPAVEREGALLVWQVVGAPGLTIGLLGAILALLLVATQIPQGLPDAALGAGRSFSAWRALEGFGLGRVATSWPMLLLFVLLALNLVGLWLRRRLAGGPERLGFEGARVRAEVAEVSAADGPALARRVEAWFPASRVVVRASRVEARRGRAREGAVAVVLGLVVLGAAGAIHAFGGQEGLIVTRVGPPPGMEARVVTQVLALGGRDWLPGPPLEVHCPAVPDTVDVFTCSFAGAGAHTTAVLAPGQPVWLPGLRVTLERVDRVRGLQAVDLVLVNRTTGEEAPMAAQPGRPYDVGLSGPGGDVELDLVATHGVEGPVAAVSGPTGAFVFAGADEDGASAGAPLGLRGGMDRQLVMHYATTTHRPVAVAGAVLLLLGVVMLALPGHLELVARELVPGRWTVRVASLDRPERAKDVARTLASTPEVPA